MALLGIAVSLAGCGGGGGSTSTSIATTTAAKPKGHRQKQKQKQKQKQEPSKQGGSQAQKASGAAPTDPNPLPNQGTEAVAPGVPTVKHGDNSIQTYGTEGPAADRVAIAATAQAYLNDLAAGRWAAACSLYPAATQRKMANVVQRSPRIGGSGCGPALGALLVHAPKSLLRSKARIEVVSFRVKGPQAFIVYRNGGKYYNLPLHREGGQWKITATFGIPLVLGGNS